jgi:hypothetical protein
MFANTEPDRPRNIRGKWCGRPAIRYDARESLAYGGYDIFFYYETPMEVHYDTPANKRQALYSTSAGINITACGEFSHFLGSPHSNIRYPNDIDAPCPSE